MKKTILAGLFCLLIAFGCINILNASATINDEDLHVTLGLPEEDF